MKVLSVAELLREVGATAEAAYCDLMAKLRAISRGLDTEGNQVSATQNLVQMEAAVQTLRDMRHACMEGLNQKKRGVSRLRGFITEELFRVFEMDVASFHSILELAEANEFDVTKMHNTMLWSAVNETMHALLRQYSKNLVISDVARGAAQILEASMIVSDPARTWNVPFGIGYHSSYECADAHSVGARSEATVQFRHHNYAQSSPNRLWPLQRHSPAEPHTTAHDADKEKLEAFSRATMAQHDIT